MDNPGPAKRPEPIALICRVGKGCRQYVFETTDELQAWASRKPYSTEHLVVMPMLDRRYLPKATMPAKDAHAYVCRVVGEARQAAEAAASLAASVLADAEEANGQCSVWFLSALCQLASTQPHMNIRDVLAFARMAMPTSAKELAAHLDYLAGQVV
jgi:hypothetical protein